MLGALCDVGFFFHAYALYVRSIEVHCVEIMCKENKLPMIIRNERNTQNM